MVGTSSFFTLLKDWVEWSGHEQILPLTLIATGLGDTTGRVIAGLVSWLTNEKVTFSLSLSLTYLILVITLYMASIARTQALVIFSAYGLGVTTGSQVVLNALSSTTRNDPRDVGAILFFGGLGALAGPPLTGYLVDQVGYTLTLRLVIIFPACGTLACMVCFLSVVNVTFCRRYEIIV